MFNKLMIWLTEYKIWIFPCSISNEETIHRGVLFAISKFPSYLRMSMDVDIYTNMYISDILPFISLSPVIITITSRVSSIVQPTMPEIQRKQVNLVPQQGQLENCKMVPVSSDHLLS